MFIFISKLSLHIQWALLVHKGIFCHIARQIERNDEMHVGSRFNLFIYLFFFLSKIVHPLVKNRKFPGFFAVLFLPVPQWGVVQNEFGRVHFGYRVRAASRLLLSFNPQNDRVTLSVHGSCNANKKLFIIYLFNSITLKSYYKSYTILILLRISIRIS